MLHERWRRLLNTGLLENSPVDRIARMHDLTPEQIGIDYDVLSKLVPLEHFIKHHSLEAILDAAARLYGVETIREWLARRDKLSSSPGDSSPSQK